MYHLKLIKALSYSGIVRATREKPDVYVEDIETANKAVATGYFKLLGGEASGSGKVVTGHLSRVQLETFDILTLAALASDMGIDASNLTSKAELIEAIASEEVEIGDLTPEEEEALNEEMFGSADVAEENEDKLTEQLKYKSVAELKEIANEKGVGIKGLSRKDDIVAAIVESDLRAAETLKEMQGE